MQALFERTRKALASAREHYGNRSQVLIVIGELAELASVLAKYDRYNTHEKAVACMREKALEECADVLNSIDHVQAIFDITDEELIEAAARKGDRLLRWLHSEGQEVTMEDRDVPDDPCSMCSKENTKRPTWYCLTCKAEPGYKGFTPKE